METKSLISVSHPSTLLSLSATLYGASLAVCLLCPYFLLPTSCSMLLALCSALLHRTSARTSAQYFRSALLLRSPLPALCSLLFGFRSRTLTPRSPLHCACSFMQKSDRAKNGAVGLDQLEGRILQATITI